MKRLRISVKGRAYELCVGKFPKDIAEWMIGYYEEMKPYVDMEELWYGDELFPIDWTDGKDSYEFDDVIHELGFAFEDEFELEEFLNDDLLQPDIKGVYINNKKLKYDLRKTIQNYRDIDLPVLNKNEVFVYHGHSYIASIDYIIDIEKHFSEKDVCLHFFNCDNYGYILTQIDYDGKQMERVYSNTNIQVKPKWIDRTRDLMAKRDSLTGFEGFTGTGFLEVEFINKRG